MSDDFETLREETGLEIAPPAGFVACAVRPGSPFVYQRAWRSPAGDIELRYRIDSMKRMKEQMALLGGATLALKGLHESTYVGAVFNLSNGNVSSKTVRMTREQAKAWFGADWGALTFIRLGMREFAPEFDSAAVFFLHKDDVADVFLIGVFNEASGAGRLFDSEPGVRFR